VDAARREIRQRLMGPFKGETWDAKKPEKKRTKRNQKGGNKKECRGKTRFSTLGLPPRHLFPTSPTPRKLVERKRSWFHHDTTRTENGVGGGKTSLAQKLKVVARTGIYLSKRSAGGGLIESSQEGGKKLKRGVRGD